MRKGEEFRAALSCQQRVPIVPRPWAAVIYCIAIALLMVAAPRHAGAQAATAPFAEGQKVEIREGDTWSSASILKREGRRFLVHYDGTEASTDEWVTTDRMRALAGAAPNAPNPPAGPGGSPATTRPAARFPMGQPVEYKSWWDWKRGVVVNIRGKWYFVQHEGNRNEREWVEPWRLRKVGSTEDAIGNCDSYGTVRNGQGPPRDDPGDPPQPKEWTHDAIKRQEREKASLAAPLTPCDRSAVVEAHFGADPGTPFKPDPEPHATRPLVPRSVPLAGAIRNFFGEDLFVSSPQTGILAAAVYNDDRAGIERVDVAQGRLMNEVVLPIDTINMDLSPDGKLLATRSNGSSGNDRLAIWNVEAAEARHVVSLKPYDQGNSFSHDLKWARFIGNDRVLTCNSGGALVLWDLKAKAIWTAAAPHADSITLSPGRLQIAMLTLPTITVIDAMSGQTLRVLNASAQQRGGKMCFKPDGTQLAMSSEDRLVVYDLISGRLVSDFNPRLNGSETLAWVADRYILAGGTNLIGLDEQMLVWLYGKHPPGEIQPQPNPANVRQRRVLMGQEVRGIYWQGRYWYAAPPLAGGGDKFMLTSIVLPDEHVRAALGNKAVLAEQMAVRPGGAVSLEVTVPDNIKEKVTRSLRANLLLNGLSISDGQAVKLVASCDSGKSQEMVYGKGMFFLPMGQPPADAVHMTVSTMIEHLAFVDSDGHVLWERKAAILPPGRMQLKKDQSIEDAVNEAMQPTEFFYVRTMLPRLVPKAAQTYGFGVSQLTAQGAIASE